ncbi:unnamed protein product [Symbiodinium natans]|uniref:Uncharacterized protein n=1 Tax=Symbiodinium natans TaxID=878477 RepID=A0A812U282_9DINO|nr:unnamed protein product [Symbiodinium natans]
MVYNQPTTRCSYTQALERELRSSSRTLRTLDDSCAGLEQKLADQTSNAVEVLAGRLKVKLRFSGMRCFMAWRQCLVVEKAQRWREAEAKRILDQSDAQLLRLQGRALHALRAAKHRAIGLEHVGDMLFRYHMKILQVHLFMSWRLHCKAENFSKAWQTHKTELQERRQEVIRQALESDEDIPAPISDEPMLVDDSQDQLAQLRAVQAAAAQDATERAVRRAQDEATQARRGAQEAAERLRVAQLEAREWLAAFDAASLELAKAQSANEDGAADEAVEEAAEYLREVEAAKARADAEVIQLQQGAATAARNAAAAEEVLEKAKSAAAAQLRAIEARKAAEEKVASKARAAAEAERRAQQRAHAAKKKEAASQREASAALQAPATAEKRPATGVLPSTVQAAPQTVLQEPSAATRALVEEDLQKEGLQLEEEMQRHEKEEAVKPPQEEERQKQEEERRKQDEAQREEERLLEEERKRQLEDMDRRRAEELRQAEERRRYQEAMEEEQRRLREEELERDRQKAEQLADRMSSERQQELLSECTRLWQEAAHAVASERRRLEARRKHEEEVRRMKEEAVAKAERVADSVAEKMYRQQCDFLLQEAFSCWYEDHKEASARKKEEQAKQAYQEEKKRLQQERDAQAAESQSLRAEAERKALEEHRKLKQLEEARRREIYPEHLFLFLKLLP